MTEQKDTPADKPAQVLRLRRVVPEKKSTVDDAVVSDGDAATGSPNGVEPQPKLRIPEQADAYDRTFDTL